MLLEWFQLLANLDAALVAGLASRFLGVVFFIHFLSALPQMFCLSSAGTGSSPYALFSAAKRDLGILRGFFKFPSIFWLSTADWMVVLVPVLGLIAASSIIVGALGPYTAWAFFVVWLCALSLQTANTNLFWFPWDNLLTEVALVGLFLPPLKLLPAVEAIEPASQLALYMYGWLLFRVMFGMGLAKFRRWDERTREGTYLYHFLGGSRFRVLQVLCCESYRCGFTSWDLFLFGVSKSSFPSLSLARLSSESDCVHRTSALYLVDREFRYF